MAGHARRPVPVAVPVARARAGKRPDAVRLSIGRDDVGFLLARASQRWNDALYTRFVAAGYPEVRPSYGAILVPLFEEDGLRIGEVARRAGLSKQTLTTLVRMVERDGLVERRPDPSDGRASLLFLTGRARAFKPFATSALAQLDAAVATALTRAKVDELKQSLGAIIELGAEAR